MRLFVCFGGVSCVTLRFRYLDVNLSLSARILSESLGWLRRFRFGVRAGGPYIVASHSRVREHLSEGYQAVPDWLTVSGRQMIQMKSDRTKFKSRSQLHLNLEAVGHAEADH